MLLSIFSNPNTVHLIEFFFWLLSAFLIGLFFGRFIKTKEIKSHNNTNIVEHEDINIIDDISKIRATQTFKRGGVEMIGTVTSNPQNGMNFNRIGLATSHDKDDLQLIKGIGVMVEEKLNDIGIFTFKQISNFNGKDIHRLTDLIKFFPGRIERDDWVGQAYNLLNEKKE